MEPTMAPKPTVEPTMAPKPTTAPKPTVVRNLTVASKPTMALTRQSIAKRRETKSCFTKPDVNAANPTAMPSTSSSVLSAANSEFRKPNEVEIRTNKPKLSSSTSLKCQYCDKCFMKSHGMTTHLLEKCEKIPASVRRQLLKKAEISNDVTSKQLLRYEALRYETDSISKYSRFFVNVSNDGTSGLQKDEVEKGLKNLRAELRKIKGAHTGIIRTPNKPLRCHICKKHFLDCVDYAEHITNHP